MLQTHIKKIAYAIRHKYATFNNVVIVAAFIIAAGWVWGSLGVMQRNYDLQKEVDYRRQQLELAQLQVDNLTLQNQYYQTNEYRELHILFLLRPYLEKSLKGAKLAQGLLLGNANDHRELRTLFLRRP